MERTDRKHYLDFEYAKPNEAGLHSTAPAVAKRLSVLLNALANVNEWCIEQGELTEACWNFRMELFTRLKADGWTLSNTDRGLSVRAPRSEKQAEANRVKAKENK